MKNYFQTKLHLFLNKDEELESKKFKEAIRKFQKLFNLKDSDKLVNCNYQFI